MSEEEKTKVEAVAEEVKAEATAETTEEATPKKKKKKWPIVVGVIAVVVIAAGAGFWVWHEQPSFCNAICHTPMDPYNETYDQVAGQAGVDKWGNEVSNSSAMMAVTHKELDVTCMGCHVPTLSEQIGEGITWVTGNYEYPLEERTLEDLTEARGLAEEEFCFDCHAKNGNISSKEELLAATADQKRNPHQFQHGDVSCGECHKAHRASVNSCSSCHSDSTIPDGWLSVADANKLDKAA